MPSFLWLQHPSPLAHPSLHRFSAPRCVPPHPSEPFPPHAGLDSCHDLKPPLQPALAQAAALEAPLPLGNAQCRYQAACRAVSHTDRLCLCMQDMKDNITRFVVLSRDPLVTTGQEGARFKTSIVFSLQEVWGRG